MFYPCSHKKKRASEIIKLPNEHSMMIKCINNVSANHSVNFVDY